MAQLTSYSGNINAKQHTVAILEDITKLILVMVVTILIMDWFDALST